MPLVKGFGQGKGDPRAGPDHCRFLDAELHGDSVCCLKANAPNVAGKPIGILRDQPDRIGAIGFVDPYRARCADTIGVEEDHNLTDSPLIGPTRSDSISALRSNAGDFPQPMRFCFDDVEYLVEWGCRIRQQANSE